MGGRSTFVVLVEIKFIPLCISGIICGPELIACSHLAECLSSRARLNYPGAVVQRGLCTEFSSTW